MGDSFVVLRMVLLAGWFCHPFQIAGDDLKCSRDASFVQKNDQLLSGSS
jgi:hypothetical protein